MQPPRDCWPSPLWSRQVFIASPGQARLHTGDWRLTENITEKFASWLSRSSLPPEVLRTVSARPLSSAPPPPPPEAAHQESYLSGSSGSYVEEMYEAWAYDPKSVHASWDAYFRGGAYQSPPTLGRKYPPGALSGFCKTSFLYLFFYSHFIFPRCEQ